MNSLQFVIFFMQFTKSEEARKACFKILTDNPEGCTKTLMEKIAEIDSFPDGRGSSHAKTVKTDETLGEKKTCRDCKRMGHSTAECWGKCKFCGRYGHRSELCRTKIRSDQAEALKKAAAATVAKKRAKGKRRIKQRKSWKNF